MVWTSMESAAKWRRLDSQRESANDVQKSPPRQMQEKPLFRSTSTAMRMPTWHDFPRPDIKPSKNVAIEEIFGKQNGIASSVSS